MPNKHGIKITEQAEAARQLSPSSTAIIALVATADDADDAFFPLNEIVKVNNITEAISKSGITGTLKNSLTDINAQVSTTIFVIRVADDADESALEINVIGGVENDVRTGIKAIEMISTSFGMDVNIIGCPGLETAGTASALAAMAEKINGMAYVSAPADNVTEAAAFRGGLGNREIMVLYPDFIGAGGRIIKSSAAAMGLRAKIDGQVGFHKSISNINVSGVIGISAAVSWSLTAENTDADQLNDGEITTLIQNNGFKFWGNKTCSSDPIYKFEGTVRTAQVIKKMVADGHMWAIDKPLTKMLSKDIVEGVNAGLRRFKTEGRIIDGECFLDSESNTQSTIVQGLLKITYKFTAVPPLESLEFKQVITDEYLADFAAGIA